MAAAAFERRVLPVPVHRLLLTRLTRAVLSLLAKRRVRDANVPFKLIRRTLYEHLRPAMRPDTFVWFVARASATQLTGLMAHPHLRHVVFDEIFRRMGEHLDPHKAATLRAVVHWRFTSDDGYDRFETVISDGVCTSGTEPTADPRVTITLAPADFLRLVTGGVHVAMLFMRGKVKVRGDIAFAANLINYFDLPG